ncbi:MAG: YbhB/YbcL family Raf kinase inhibitor-like protein [Methanomicrobiaceae archaeon]|nr:YbhB/YbcL family Raf kinase inhibitor-like protein [Methanomicrobiaceae archaeon]
MENLIVEIAFTEFPRRHTCDGENISPEIVLKRVHAPYLAILVNDPDTPGRAFNHWAAWNIEATDRIPEGIPTDPAPTSPISCVQGTNSAGTIGYSGPCPPRGETHRFFFNIYGLDARLDLPSTATKRDLERAMEGHMVQYGGYAVAQYKRQEQTASTAPR